MKPVSHVAPPWAVPLDRAEPTRLLMAFSCMMIRRHMNDGTAAMRTFADTWHDEKGAAATHGFTRIVRNHQDLRVGSLVAVGVPPSLGGYLCPSGKGGSAASFYRRISTPHIYIYIYIYII